MQTNSNNSIHSFLIAMLRARFPNQPFKHKPITLADNKGFRFHCPFCGDTNSEHKVPRGNIKVEYKRFSCYNGDCKSNRLPLNKFISILSKKYSISIDDIDLDAIAPILHSVYPKKIAITSSGDNPIREYFMDSGLMEKLPSIEQISELLDIKPLREFELWKTMVDTFNSTNTIPLIQNEDNKPLGYDLCYYLIVARHLHKTPITEKSVYINSDLSQLYIMNMDFKTNRVLSYCRRSFPDKQYMLEPYSRMKMIFRYDIDEEYNQMLEQLSNAFNIFNVDLSNKVKMAEGQFDSMFAINCVSCNGVAKSTDLIKKYLKEFITVSYFDDDKAGVLYGVRKDTDGFFMFTKFKDDLCVKYNKYRHEIEKIHDLNELFSFMFKVKNFNYSIEEFDNELNGYEGSTYAEMLFL